MSHSMSRLGLLLICLLFTLSVFAQDYAPGEVIVKLKPETAGGTHKTSFIAKASAQRGLRLKESFSRLNMHHFTLTSGQSVEDAVADLKTDPSVQYAEPNYYFRKTDEPGFHQAFSASQVQAAAATGESVATGAPVNLQNVWSLSYANTSRPVVAILDTGVDSTHTVLQKTDALWLNPREIAANGIDDDGNGFIDDVYGYNFVANTGNIADDEGHGTHVTGIVLSVDQDIFASVPRPSRIQIMTLKILDANGIGKDSDAIRAINYAVENGAIVLNSSWGGSNFSQALLDAIAESYSHGALFVAAAGNSGTDNDSAPLYPANYDVPNVISVAASTDRDELASFSNYGASSVGLASPGVFIMSLLPGGQFGTMSGTSMASPFVAGTAAQMKAASPQMLGFQIKQIIFNQASRIAGLNGKVASSGRLDPFQSITTASTAALNLDQPAYATPAEAPRAPASVASSSSVGGCSSKGIHGGVAPLSSVAAILALLLAQIGGLVYLRTRAKAEDRRSREG